MNNTTWRIGKTTLDLTKILFGAFYMFIVTKSQTHVKLSRTAAMLNLRRVKYKRRQAAVLHSSHSRPHRSRSFWSALRITTPGQVQHRKSAIHGLSVTVRMFNVNSDKSDWFWSQSIVFTKPFRTGISLDENALYSGTPLKDHPVITATLFWLKKAQLSFTFI